MTQEEKDKSNPHWRPEWSRRQKRTTKPDPGYPVSAPVIPAQINDSFKSLIPAAALTESPTLTPDEFTQLLKALESFAANNLTAISIAQFVTDYTNLEPNFIHAYISNHEEDSKHISGWEKRLHRARARIEHNIISIHVQTNPAFAQFYLKNKHGYVDKSEQSVVGTMGIQVISNVPMPDPPPKLLKEANG